MREKKSLLNNLKNMAYRISLAIALGIFLYVFLCAFTNFESMPFLKGALTGIQKGIFMFIGTGLGVMLLFSIQKATAKWEHRRMQVVMGCIFAVMVCGQMFFLFHMKINLRYDALKVLDEAISVCKTGSVSNVHLDGYFARYTNNYPILFLTVGILKIARLLGLVNETYAQAGMVVGFVNLLAIDVAVYFSVKLMKKIGGMKAAFIGLIMIACNPLFYIWVPFYYTNTMAMPFIAVLLYLFFVLIEDGGISNKNTIVYAFLIGLFGVIGIKIRATTLFTILAGILFFVLKQKKDSEKSSKYFQKIGIRLVAAVLGIGLAAGAYQLIERALVPFDYSDSAFPAIHWINMGAGGTGEYSIVDEQITMGYATKEEKTSANLLEYQSRLDALGIGGYVKLMFAKLKLTFADAGAGYHSELGVSDLYQETNLFLVGGKSDGVGVLVQINYLLCLSFGILAIARILKQKKTNFYYMIFINILGGFCFHMIWEAGTIYSLSFAMLFPFCVTAGFEAFERIAQSNAEKDRLKKSQIIRIATSVVLTFGTVFVAAGLYQKAVDAPYETNDAVVNQYIYEWGDDDMLMDEEVYEQSFFGNRTYNRITFQVRNLLGVGNDAVYRIELLDELNKQIETFEIKAADYGDYDFIRLTCLEVVNEVPQNYSFRIQKIAGSEANNLVFLSYKTGNYDAYSYGELKEEENRDLCFSVYEAKKQPYISKLGFFSIVILLLVLEAVIQIYLYRCQKEGPFLKE